MGKRKQNELKKAIKNKKELKKLPCKRYPKSYALKHWQLGKSWLITEYFVVDSENNEVKNYNMMNSSEY